MIGGIWLGSAVTTLLAVVYFQEADAIHCLVCSSDKALRSGLYHKNCKNPTKDWQTKDHPNLWDCSNYDATMNKHLKEWRDELGKKQNITERKHSESPGCTEYSICRSMYYEADMEYHLLTGGRMYRMVDDKEHVFRYCGCLYSSEVKKAQADLIKVEFSGKGTKCEDEIKGKVRKRRCACNPSHSSFSGIKACNFATHVQPDSFQMGSFLVIAWLLMIRHLQK